MKISVHFASEGILTLNTDEDFSAEGVTEDIYNQMVKSLNKGGSYLMVAKTLINMKNVNFISFDDEGEPDEQTLDTD